MNLSKPRILVRHLELAARWLGSRGRVWPASFLLALVVLALASGCRKPDESTHVMTMEGRVEKIKLTSDSTGEITVLYIDKDQQEVMGTGMVTLETEVMINGAIATLADVREGERIRGEVRVARKGQRRTQTILKIYIDRAEPVTPAG